MRLPWLRKKEPEPRGWTLDRIIEEFPDANDWMRHMVFCRFVLGENTTTSAMIANRCENTPLTRTAMEMILFDWIITRDGKWKTVEDE